MTNIAQMTVMTIFVFVVISLSEVYSFFPIIYFLFSHICLAIE